MQWSEGSAVFHLYRRRKWEERHSRNLKDQRQEEFVEAAVSLLRNTYINGTYCMDDWNMYDVDLTTVPVTNNGNEGWNSSSKTDYGTHPQANKFILTSCVLLEESEDNIMQLLYNSRKPRINKLYDKLKEDREVLKQTLAEGLELDEYMGKIGGMSAKIGQQKFTEKYTESDFAQSLELEEVPLTMRYTRSQKKRNEAHGVSQEKDMVKGKRGKKPVTLLSKKNVNKKADANKALEVEDLSHESHFSYDDSLAIKIKKFNLPVKRTEYDTVSDGNCFYDAVAHLCSVQNIKLRNNTPDPTDSATLRQALHNELANHPNRENWIKGAFKGKKRD